MGTEKNDFSFSLALGKRKMYQLKIVIILVTDRRQHVCARRFATIQLQANLSSQLI